MPELGYDFGMRHRLPPHKGCNPLRSAWIFCRTRHQFADHRARETWGLSLLSSRKTQ